MSSTGKFSSESKHLFVVLITLGCGLVLDELIRNHKLFSGLMTSDIDNIYYLDLQFGGGQANWDIGSHLLS